MPPHPNISMLSMERIAQASEPGAHPGLHCAQRLAEPGGNLAVAKALKVGHLNDLALMWAEGC